MELLTGEYRNTLDEKGRILFPAKLRTELTGEKLIITQAVDNCLWLFTPDEWKNFSAKLMDAASPFSGKSRLVVRHLIAPAQTVEFDKAGRISIPQSLREYAALSKECVILGINKYMELWDANAYKTYLEESEPSFREATEGLSGICL
ncbi:division/cell wall cluster transcriptional repressor MraZ [Treponema brennaborense]|uniref:Transcriptional regulator MraZ n=1 Tax=Treponema brennaborense (strain DSM 12168 / CIP 105900 / DD5/3) TaxID=906968 RepID=F4LJI7_TREBD|nr:division/cell wall cluster transcriptional repressor MraZ [Treponema brennaborense]AEE16382.1 Protein mraZ [Treponema brennaborense DSM 12168]